MYNNYFSDIDNDYGAVITGAYDKARMWPLEDMSGGLAILEDEITEVRDAFIGLENAYNEYFYDAPSSKERFEKNPRFACQTLEGHAMSTILELLQVIAVCRKYVEVFEEEAAAGCKKVGEEEEDEQV